MGTGRSIVGSKAASVDVNSKWRYRSAVPIRLYVMVRDNLPLLDAAQNASVVRVRLTGSVNY
jgi:hypothetical protein